MLRILTLKKLISAVSNKAMHYQKKFLEQLEQIALQ